ncbi:hypothetical protein [Rubritalea tangerina]|uniref:hypothetical protein n=1 Tax=Rubritalea tangerina TaxID=430798 RepID=UPI0036189D2C
MLSAQQWLGSSAELWPSLEPSYGSQVLTLKRSLTKPVPSFLTHMASPCEFFCFLNSVTVPVALITHYTFDNTHNEGSSDKRHGSLNTGSESYGAHHKHPGTLQNTLCLTSSIPLAHPPIPCLGAQQNQTRAQHAPSSLLTKAL